MPDTMTFGLFLTAALIIAVTPDPGIFYVLTRSLKGGRGEGFASTFGNSLGGLVHVVAAALGLSAILIATAMAFTGVKLAGAAYLIFLGVRKLLGNDEAPAQDGTESGGHRDAFYQGIVAEALNPKTALFLLAFLPQFVTTQGPIVFQILLLGCISVFLNTVTDLVVACFAGPLGELLRESVRLRRGHRLLSGSALIGLGAYVALAAEKR